MAAHKPMGLSELLVTPGDPRVHVGEQRIILRAQELALLELLIHAGGRLLSTTTIAKHLGRGGRRLGDKAVAVYVHRLRLQLETVGHTIRALRGFGYTLERLEDKKVSRSRSPSR